MPSITLDGHTLSVDGRRLWVVSGTVMYTQTPRASWGARLRAAREAGLNTIEVPVVWSAHEPRQGKFNFDGDLDLAAFVKAIDQHGLHAIVRVGPYVGEGLDLGGLPPWLPALKTGQVRSHAGVYLASVSAFLSAVCDRIASLQITGGPSRRGKGPIIALVAEHRWLCGDDGVISLATNTGGVLKEGTDHLAEIARFLREGGINVPVIANNDLYHSAEGQIEAWSGRHHLHANLRQLRAQRPQQPRLLLALRGASDADGLDRWGHPARPGPEPRQMVRALAEALSAGAQFNIESFAPGARLGFSAGRLPEGPGAYLTPGSSGAVVTEAGKRTERFQALKRIATFASTFDRVLSGLDPAYQPVTIATDAGPLVAPKGRGAAGSPPPAAVVHAHGSQGSVVFVFADGEGKRTVKLVLGDGSTLPVTLEEQSAAWVLLDTHLGGRATLDYCNVCPFAVAGKALVCYGPAGTAALLSINGSAVDIKIPDDDRPLIKEIEGVALALCNERSINRAIATPEGIWFGVESLDADGSPVPCAGVSSVLRLGADGSVRTASLKGPSKVADKFPLSAWSVAPCTAHITGESPRYARIEKPDGLVELGSPTGYGWYRVRFKSATARKPKVGLFEAADRVHAWSNGSDAGVFGDAPGADSARAPVNLTIPKGDVTLVMLADNMGRFAEGSLYDDRKGVWGDPWEVAAVKTAAPALVTDAPVEPLKFRTPIMGLQIGDATDPRRLQWKFKHTRKTPVFACIDVPTDDGSLAPGLVLLNGAPVSPLLPGVPLRLRFDHDRLKPTSTLELAIVGDMEHAAKVLKGAVHLYAGDACLTEKGDWAFAKWEPPSTAASWEPAKKGGRAGGPAWYRANFTPTPHNGSTLPALALDTHGLSKGVAFINGYNLGRYFTATATGKAVGPQTVFPIPESWIKPGAENEVMLFDEHGFSPSGVRVVAV